MLVVTILFSLVRPHHTVVYAPKKKHAEGIHKPPETGNGILDWVPPLRTTKEDELIKKIGLDAAIFLRFLKMCRNIFLALAVLGGCVLIPVHVTTTKSLLSSVPASTGHPSTSDSLTDALAAITPLNVTGNALWSHVAASYIIDFVVMFFLWYNYRAVVRLKRNYFESSEYRDTLHARSIWMADIPRADRSDERMLQILDSIENTAGLPRAAIARNVKGLPAMIKEHEEAVRKLEGVLAKYLKNPDRLPPKRPTMRASRKDTEYSGTVDAIDYLTRRIRNLEVIIKDTRATIDKRDREPYGFATYDQIADAHVVAYKGRKKKPNGVRIRLAPSPNDLIWENLSLDKKTRARKRIGLNFLIVMLTIIYIVPNALIAAFLSDLSNLANLWPAFMQTYTNDRGLWQFVQAVLSPALLSLIYLALPILFRRWSASSGDLTKTSREQHVIQKLYVFFVFNNLIVFSVFSTLFKFVLSVVGFTASGEDAWTAIQDSDITNSLLKSLCAVSNFWFIWLIQRNLGAAIDLAQLFNLAYKWFVRTFMAATPRKAIEWTAPPPFDYASYYNWFLFYVTVAVCFATVQPLVLVVTFIYFLIDTWLKKYLLLYIFITKTESGGKFWNIIFNRILFATFMANCVAALVIKGCWGQWGANSAGNSPAYYMMGSMIPLPLILLAFKIYCSRTYANQLNYYTTSHINVELGSDQPKQRYMNKDKVAVKFGHPALYKKLMTPMVHAKAQHVLRQLLGGGEHDQAQTGYGDIEMSGMRQEPNDVKDMFEIVQENQLDFANFKNRADFADEHGGQGELYGRQADLMSERSKTPMTVMSDDEFSRSGTPVPLTGTHQNHPAYHHKPQEGVRNFYDHNNDSQRSLLNDAGPGGYAPLHANQTQEELPHYQQQHQHQQPGAVMGLDRWRNGASGYVGVAERGDEDDIGYEAYRQPAYQQDSYRRYR